MSIKTKLLAAGAALLLSTGAALAVPATAESDLNVRSGPGTQYPVIGSIADGETVDVGSCTGSWCQVRFSGGTGYASRRYLAMGGGAVMPGPAVAVSPYIYDDDDYDDSYAYGPSIGIYAGPSYRQRGYGWRGGHEGWRGRQGNWNRPGRPGGGTVGVAPQPGFAGPPASWQRPGTGIGRQGGVSRSAPAGMRGGGGAAAPARAGGAPSGGSGFTGVPLAAPHLR